jgi:hypothetical protein
MPLASSIDALLTARYFFGHLSLGVAGELGLSGANFAAVRAGVGPALGVAFVDTHETRVLLGVNYLPVGSAIDPARLVADFEVAWRFLTFQVQGGTSSTTVNGVLTVGWQVAGFVGARASW